MKCKSTLFVLAVSVLLLWFIPNVFGTTVYYYSSRGCVFASSGKGIGFSSDKTFNSPYRESNASYTNFWFFESYGLFTSGANMTVTKWFESSWLNYTVTGAGTQKLYPSPLQGSKPSTVVLDGVAKTENDGWTFSTGVVTVTGATANASLSWGGGVDNPPVAGAYSVSSTLVGLTATFTCAWTDDYLLAQGLLSHNGSGVWQNRTALTLSGSSDIFSDSFVLPSSFGSVVGYKFYAKDNNNQWSASSTYYLITTSQGSSTNQKFTLTVNVHSASGVVAYARVSVSNSYNVVVQSKVADRNGTAVFTELASSWYFVSAESEEGNALEKVNLDRNKSLSLTVSAVQPWYVPDLPEDFDDFVEKVGESSQWLSSFAVSNLGSVVLAILGLVSVFYGRREDDGVVSVVGVVLLVSSVGVYFLPSLL
jgi:hypothetical protein